MSQPTPPQVRHAIDAWIDEHVRPLGPLPDDVMDEIVAVLARADRIDAEAA